jgi:hypothetical protein
MGPMIRGEKFDRRRLTKIGAAGLIAMFLWSLIAAPSSVGQAEEIVEPESLSSYYTFGDALPVGSYFDHQALPAPAFGPALAHSNTEVALPSEASAIAWLMDAGIANGLHGTTTGASVPTEVNAKQPGGDSSAEFTTVGGPIGEEEFGRLAAGVARASASHSDSPRGVANAYFQDLCLFPAAGSPPNPPGTYDPDATFPGGEDPPQGPKPDPGPLARQCIVSVASMASTSQSYRDNDTVTSIGVAELTGITIGDRTSDNRCTNCFYIDGMRVEAFASSNGQPGGSRAGYRLMFGRMCRRTFEPSALAGPEDTITSATGGTPEPRPAHEVDQCLGDPRREGFPNSNADAGSDVLREFQDIVAQTPVEDLNDFFAKPLILGDQTCPGYDKPCTIAIKLDIGTTHVEPSRLQHTTNPPEDACRNFAYPDPDRKAKPNAECTKFGTKTGPDKDNGQEAKAVAQGIDIDVLTSTAGQLIPQNADLESCFDALVPDPVKDNEQLGGAYDEVKNQAGCPFAGLRSVRELDLTFGIAQANAVVRPNIVLPPIDTGGPPIVPPIDLGGTTGGVAPPPDLGGTSGGVQIVPGGGLGYGKYGLKIDWKSLRIKPWKFKDMVKAVLSGGIIAGMALLIRKRFRLRQV